MNEKYVKINGIKITVEIAKTDKEHEQGLMFRKNLHDNHGMLFIFETEDRYDFWMKNTVMPLDIIYINSDLKIVDILHATPCKKDPCESYIPKEKALYVLETKAGTFDEKIIGGKAEILT